jgi:hypothetical protein
VVWADSVLGSESTRMMGTMPRTYVVSLLLIKDANRGRSDADLTSDRLKGELFFGGHEREAEGGWMSERELGLPFGLMETDGSFCSPIRIAETAKESWHETSWMFAQVR